MANDRKKKHTKRGRKKGQKFMIWRFQADNTTQCAEVWLSETEREEEDKDRCTYKKRPDSSKKKTS